jgi:hypothetical protein
MTAHLKDPRCCPVCSARLLPDESICQTCAANHRLPPRKACPWCGDPISRGVVICQHCHSDLSLPEEGRVKCPACGGVMRARASNCFRCGTRLDPNLTTFERPLLLQKRGGSAAASPPITEALDTAKKDAASSNDAVRGLSATRVEIAVKCARLVLFVACLAGLAWCVELGRQRGWWPFPTSLLDPHVANWMWLHFAIALGGWVLALLAAVCLQSHRCDRVWNRPLLAAIAVAPVVAVPWTAAEFLAALTSLPGRIWQRLSSRESDAEVDSQHQALRQAVDRVDGPAIWYWIELVFAGAIALAALWPAAARARLPWSSPVPAALQSQVPLLAVVCFGFGVLQLLAAVLRWTWRTWEAGGGSVWLSPILILFPVLVAATASLLFEVRLNDRLAESMSLESAVVPAALFWGVASLYGLYFVATSWESLRGPLTSAVAAYLLCVPIVIPEWQQTGRRVHRLQCASRLHELGAALRQYRMDYGELPPLAVRDASGQPLLSWRVLLLPYLEQQSLYEEFRLHEPWDSPHNRELLAQRPEVFAGVELGLEQHLRTRILAPVGGQTLFPGDRSRSPIELALVPADRILLLEGPDFAAVPWTEPVDWEVDERDSRELFSGDDEAVPVLLWDGSSSEVRRTAIGVPGNPFSDERLEHQWPPGSTYEPPVSEER